MHCLWMKKSPDITCRSDRARGCPFELQHQHHLVTHPSGPTEDGFDGGIDRLDHPKSDMVSAVGGDAVEMLEEELAQPVHLRKPLPAECVTPAVEEIQHAHARLVGPEPIELLPQDIGF